VGVKPAAQGVVFVQINFQRSIFEFFDVYLNFSAMYLNFGTKIGNRVFSKGVARGGGVVCSPTTSGRFRYRCGEKIFRQPLEP